MTRTEEQIHNLEYILRMLKDPDFTRDEIIQALESEVAHCKRCLQNEMKRERNTTWDTLTEYDKVEWYKRYVEDVRYSKGSDAVVMSYDEWAEECDTTGWIIV